MSHLLMILSSSTYREMMQDPFEDFVINTHEKLSAFGTFRVPNSSSELTVEAWASKTKPMHLLPQVWIRVSGIPSRELGDFLTLWSIGSLFGKTLKVDMKYTRQHGVLRILVGCIDYTLIPDAWSVFIKDGLYELRFFVEDPNLAGSGDDDMPDVNDNNNDSHGRDANIDESNKPPSGSDVDMGNRSSSTSARNSEKSDQNGSVAENGTNKFSGVVFSPSVQKAFILARKSWVETLTDGEKAGYRGAAQAGGDEVNDEDRANSVVAEKSLFFPDTAGKEAGVVAAGIIHGKSAVTENNSVSSSASGDENQNCVAMTGNHSDFVVNTVVSPQHDASYVETQGSPKEHLNEDLVHFANAAELMPNSVGPINLTTRRMGPVDTPSERYIGSESLSSQHTHLMGSDFEVRSSDRLRAKPNADLPQLERAMLLASRKNSPMNQGNQQGGLLDPFVVLSPSPGPAAAYGYRMCSYDGGYTGYLQPGWMVQC